MGGSNRSVIDVIREHAIAGTVATFLDIGAEEDLPPYDDGIWDDFTVAADDLAELITTSKIDRHRKGVRIVGVRIEGDLDLDEARLDRYLMLRRCHFGPYEIVLIDAETRGIDLAGSACGGLSAYRASVAGGLFLTGGFTAAGEVRLVGARIEGELACNGATLSNPEGVALNADGASVSGGAFLRDGFTAAGEVRLVGAGIGPQLACNGATLSNPEGVALNADGASVSGGAFLRDGFTAAGEVRLVGARIEGELACNGATLSNPEGVALNAERMSVTGGAFLRDGFTAAGEVRLVGAEIGPQLACDRATLSNPGSYALNADGASVTGGVFLTDGFTAAGEVRLLGAQIRGQLACNGATLSNHGGYALNADRISVTGGVFLTGGFTATGEVRFPGAQIGGQLACDGATLSNPGSHALNADGASVTGGVFLTDGFTAAGEVRLLGAQIRGQLACNGATLSNPGGHALSADGAGVTGNVFFTGGFTATGEVRLLGAEITGQLACNGATLSNPGGDALSADGAVVTGGVFLRDGFTATGLVDFTNARAASFTDHRTDWPDRLQVQGFRYDALHSDARGWKERREWLRRQVEPSPGPYRQLAEVYRASGDDVDARKILMERHNALIRRVRPVHWEPHYPHWTQRAWRRFLGITIGHGYEPWRALAFLLPVLVGMAFWYARADHQDLLVPNGDVAGVTSSECTSAHPCVQPFVYAADTLIPVIDLGQRSKWTPDVTARGPSPYIDDGRWLAAFTWVTSVLGWIFATLIVAGFSSVIRKE